MKEENTILQENNVVRSISNDTDVVSKKMGLSKEYPEPETPQVFSVSCFPREFRQEASVYIGRHGPHGNKYAIGVHGTRSEVLQKYERFTTKKLREDAEFKKYFVASLKSRHLICHCKPLDCHGDVILRLLQLIAQDDPSVESASRA